MQHAVELSALLQEYITSICSCGHITVNVTITSGTDPTAMYSVQFTGVMATEAVLSLITKMEGLTEGLYLTIVTLYLEEQTNCSNDQHKADQTGVLSYIATLSTIIVVVILMMVVLIMR